jgi:hypothetical protein
VLCLWKKRAIDFGRGNSIRFLDVALFWVLLFLVSDSLAITISKSKKPTMYSIACGGGVPK